MARLYIDVLVSLRLNLTESSKLSTKRNSVNYIAIPTTQPAAGVVWCCQTSRKQSAKCIAMAELHVQQFYAVTVRVLNIRFVIFSSK